MKLDRTEPLYIIELGAGSGKFSFFMLKALLEMKVRPNLTRLRCDAESVGGCASDPCYISDMECVA